MRTGIITYNVRERGRQHRGAERNFDTVALAALINSGDVQERVKNRDMHGYNGHWPRMIFGMNPVEGGIHEGRQITLEPALTLTSLEASPDGVIRYEVEFNDNPPGRVAHRLWKSKRGGFSSAIDCVRRGGQDVPIGFYGFDYVLEPNFAKNRGFTLDGVDSVPEEGRVVLLDGVAFVPQGERALALDGVAAEVQAGTAAMDRDYQVLLKANEELAQTVGRLATENNELVGLLAKRGATPTLDAVGKPFERPLRAGDGGGFALLVTGFASIPLAGYAPMPATGEEREQLQALDDAAASVLARWQ